MFTNIGLHYITYVLRSMHTRSPLSLSKLARFIFFFYIPCTSHFQQIILKFIYRFNLFFFIFFVIYDQINKNIYLCFIKSRYTIYVHCYLKLDFINFRNISLMLSCMTIVLFSFFFFFFVLVGRQLLTLMVPEFFYHAVSRLLVVCFFFYS